MAVEEKASLREPMRGKRLPWSRSSRTIQILVAVILLLSLVLRVSSLDAFLAGDESKWFCRSLNFRHALLTGDLAETRQSEHPGVVTMWLGAAATSLGHAGPWVDYCLDMGGDKLTRVDSNDELLRLPGLIARGRLAVALFTWIGMVLVWFLLRQLVGELSAACALILIALDPFCLALSRVMHLDAVLATLMMLSLLSLMVYVRGERSRSYLLASAIAGGLAVAQKSPGGFLAIAATVALLPSWIGPAPRQIKRRLTDWVLWGAVSAMTVVVIWPALWVEPIESIKLVIGSAVGYAETPHGNSNFFWRAIRPDPGPFFYPVAWAFRITPMVAAGLLGLVSNRRKNQRWLVWGLFIYAVAYGLFMTTGAKKFDRYLLPAFLPLDILTGLGLARILTRVGDSRLLGRWQGQGSGWLRSTALLALVVLFQVAPFVTKSPYYFSYYNPLLGGAATAQDILLTGWGEGMEQAAEYLNAKPNADQFHVNTAHIAQFAPFFVGHTSSASDLDLAESDYYVFYANTVQRLREPQVLLRFLGVQEPEKIVRVDGIDYVWIYANTLTEPALDYLAQEGDAETDLLVVDVDTSLVRHYEGAMPLVRVDGGWGNDAILRGLEEATVGRRRVWHLTFDETLGDSRQLVARHLSTRGSVSAEAAFDGIKLTAYDLDTDAVFQIPQPPVLAEARFGESISLRGFGLDLRNGGAGLELSLYWRAQAPVQESYTVFVHLLSAEGELLAQHDGQPVGGQMPTDTWRSDETVVDAHLLTLPEGADLAGCLVAVGLYRLDTGERLPVVVDGLDQPDRLVLLQGLDAALGESAP